MQVTCPNCGARYAVDPLAIGPVGRIVQCARCSNRWLQTVAAAAAQTAGREAVDAAVNAPHPAPESAPDTVPPPSDPKPAFSGAIPPSLGPAQAFASIEPVPDLVIRPSRQHTSLPAVIAPRRKSGVPVLIGVGLCAVVVIAAIGAALYFYREPILAEMPPEWRTLLQQLRFQ